MFIEGAAKALPRGAAFIKPARIRVTFGKPFTTIDLAAGLKPSSVDEYQFFADELRKRVEALSK